MKEEHLYTSEFKLKNLGYGEWVEEPDLVEFEHNGINCIIMRNVTKEPYAKDEAYFGGHLCGYVSIPKDSVYYGKEYDQIEIDCHYGLTLGEFDDEENYWIGFDCAHSGDLVPSSEMFRKKYYSPSPHEIQEEFKNFFIFNREYRNLAYCIEQCKSMADQLIGVKNENK